MANAILDSTGHAPRRLDDWMGGSSNALSASGAIPNGAPAVRLARALRLPSAPVHGDLFKAALCSLSTEPSRARLAALWEELLAGRAKVCGDWLGPTRSYLVVRTAAGGPAGSDKPLLEREAHTITRYLSGDQQKLIASDLGVSPAIASKHVTTSLTKMHVEGRVVPILVILAAQAVASGADVPVATEATFAFDGEDYRALSVTRPNAGATSRLTPAERVVAALFVEGRSRDEIAQRRSTSTYTVSAQLTAIFGKLGAVGRPCMLRRGTELGWFAVSAAPSHDPLETPDESCSAVHATERT
jgi:DNA-binding CsgD family transcriptional regulator